MDDPRRLYPADPQYWRVATSLTPKAAVLMSLGIDPKTIAVLTVQGAIEDSNFWAPTETDHGTIETPPTDLGTCAFEYERRLSLLHEAIDNGTLQVKATEEGTSIGKAALSNWLLSIQWDVPEWMTPTWPESATEAISIEATRDRVSRVFATAGKGPEAQSADPEHNMRIAEVAALTGMARSTIYHKMKNGQFPQSRKFHGVTGWRRGDVVAWLNQGRGNRTT